MTGRIGVLIFVIVVVLGSTAAMAGPMVSPSAAAEHAKFGQSAQDSIDTETVGGMPVTADAKDSNISIEQVGGFGSHDKFNHTKQVGIRADSNLTLDNGENYHLRLTNEDSGAAVTLAVNGSVTVPAGDPIGLLTYNSEGTVSNHPRIWPSQQQEPISADIVAGSVPSANGTTNFSVALLNASDGSEINQTATLPAVVGYTGVLEQNSTEGKVRLSLPRDVLPRGASPALVLSKGDLHDENPRFRFNMSYESSTDEFVTQVNASSFESGNYSWASHVMWQDTEVLFIAGPISANEHIVLGSPPDDSNTSIEHTQGPIRSDGDLNHTQQVAIQADSNLTFDHGENYHLRLTNNDSGAAVTLAMNGSVTVASDDPIIFSAYQADGMVSFDPSIWPPRQSPPISADVVNDSIPSANGLTNFSVALINASDGSEISRTAAKPSIVGYTGVLKQNSTEGKVRLSLPRDVIPRGATPELVLSKGEHHDEHPRLHFNMSYDSSSDEFVTVVDSSSIESGNYSWATPITWRDMEVLVVKGRFSANENITFGESVQLNLTANTTELSAGGSVKFTVTRKDTGEPVNASVAVNPTKRTGEDGVVTFTFDEVGEFTATASKAPTENETFVNDSVEISVTPAVDTSINLSDASGTPGSNVTVELSANGSGVAGYQANITFNNSVARVVEVNGVDFGDPTANIQNEDGYVFLSGAAATGQDDPVMAEITFNITGTNGSTSLAFQEGDTKLTDKNGDEITIGAYNDGNVAVQQCTRGDANGDGGVSSGDATLVLRNVVGLIDESELTSCADANGDGSISSGDATIILRIVVGLE